jgi:hypothetical protein
MVVVVMLMMPPTCKQSWSRESSSASRPAVGVMVTSSPGSGPPSAVSDDAVGGSRQGGIDSSVLLQCSTSVYVGSRALSILRASLSAVSVSCQRHLRVLEPACSDRQVLYQ